jgi:hypothetical protein
MLRPEGIPRPKESAVPLKPAMREWFSKIL